MDKLIQPVIVNKSDKIIWVPGIAHATIKQPNNSEILKEVQWKQT